LANFATLDIATRDSLKKIAYGKVLLAHVDQASLLPYQKPLFHITNYMIGELENAASAAWDSQTLKVAAATRNLFELSFVAEYICASDQNMDRFIVDADIDELEIMQKLLAIDKQNPNYQPDQQSEQREQRLKAQIATANIEVKTRLTTFQIAAAVNKEEKYRALYKVYSKMTHATAWAILGRCSWEKMALFLLLKSNGYAAECMKHLANKTGLAADTPVPAFTAL
jgi:hypothetical protein